MASADYSEGTPLWNTKFRSEGRGFPESHARGQACLPQDVEGCPHCRRGTTMTGRESCLSCRPGVNTDLIAVTKIHRCGARLRMRHRGMRRAAKPRFRSDRRRHELGRDASCRHQAKTAPAPEDHEKVGVLPQGVDRLPWRGFRKDRRDPEGGEGEGRSAEVSRAMPDCRKPLFQAQSLPLPCVPIDDQSRSTRAQSSGTSVGLGAEVSDCFCYSLTDRAPILSWAPQSRHPLQIANTPFTRRLNSRQNAARHILLVEIQGRVADHRLTTETARTMGNKGGQSRANFIVFVDLFGRHLRSGRRGRRFESCHSDHSSKSRRIPRGLADRLPAPRERLFATIFGPGPRPI